MISIVGCGDEAVPSQPYTTLRNVKLYDEGTEGAGSKFPVVPELPNPPLLAFTDGFWLSIYQNKTPKISYSYLFSQWSK